MSDHNNNVAVRKIFPCDPVIREKVMSLLEAGVSKGEIARGSNVNSSVISQYTALEGNTYEGTIEGYEARIADWLSRRELQLLSGIPTIESPVSIQIETVAQMLMKCRIMGKVIGESGIGKTRGASLLKQRFPTALLLFADGELGTRRGIYQQLLKQAGLSRSGRGRSLSRLEVTEKLYKRVREAQLLIIADQAHMLSGPAINLLVEIYNATAAPQMFLGTDKLEGKIARDEQWASRLQFTWPLEVMFDAEVNDVRELVTHQVKHRIPQIGTELKRTVALCEKIALADGHFRRVENRLNMMLFLHDRPKNKDKDWSDLFEMSGQWLPGVIAN